MQMKSRDRQRKPSKDTRSGKTLRWQKINCMLKHNWNDLRKKAREILKEYIQREVRKKAAVHHMSKLLKEQEQTKAMVRRHKAFQERNRYYTNLEQPKTAEQYEEHIKSIAEMKMEDEP